MAAARQEGRDEGQKEGLQKAIQAVCEVLGMELGPDRLLALDTMTVSELTSLLQQVKQRRAWPPG